jgi:hypothetical protein
LIRERRDGLQGRGMRSSWSGEDMGRMWRRVPAHLMVEFRTSVKGQARSREHFIRSGGGQRDRRGVPCSPLATANMLTLATADWSLARGFRVCSEWHGR